MTSVPGKPGRSDDLSGNRAAPRDASRDPRALELLTYLWEGQRGLSRPAALAWERVVFTEALSHPEPRRRIQAFLGEGK